VTPTEEGPNNQQEEIDWVWSSNADEIKRWLRERLQKYGPDALFLTTVNMLIDDREDCLARIREAMQTLDGA